MCVRFFFVFFVVYLPSLSSLFLSRSLHFQGRGEGGSGLEWLGSARLGLECGEAFSSWMDGMNGIGWDGHRRAKVVFTRRFLSVFFLVLYVLVLL